MLKIYLTEKKHWEKSKSILAKKLIKLKPQYQLEYITSKIEKVNRSRRTEFRNVSAIIAKFIRSNIIKGNSSIFVSQMFSQILSPLETEQFYLEKTQRRMILLSRRPLNVMPN